MNDFRNQLWEPPWEIKLLSESLSSVTNLWMIGKILNLCNILTANSIIMEILWMGLWVAIPTTVTARLIVTNHIPAFSMPLEFPSDAFWHMIVNSQSRPLRIILWDLQPKRVWSSLDTWWRSNCFRIQELITISTDTSTAATHVVKLPHIHVHICLILILYGMCMRSATWRLLFILRNELVCLTKTS